MLAMLLLACATDDNDVTFTDSVPAETAGTISFTELAPITFDHLVSAYWLGDDMDVFEGEGVLILSGKETSCEEMMPLSYVDDGELEVEPLLYAISIFWYNYDFSKEFSANGYTGEGATEEDFSVVVTSIYGLDESPQVWSADLDPRVDAGTLSLTQEDKIYGALESNYLSADFDAVICDMGR